jgi:hypothetical protein
MAVVVRTDLGFADRRSTRLGGHLWDHRAWLQQIA